MTKKQKTKKQSKQHKKQIKKQTKKQTTIKRRETKKILKCAPGRDHKFSCYNSSALHELKNAWNETYPNKRINSNTPYEIWSYFHTHFKSMCENEKCWLRQSFMQNKLSSSLKKYTFAPDSPESWNSNPKEWLSSDEIIDVMKQYEHTHADFVFLGPSPIDFEKKTLFNDCIWEDLCKFDEKIVLTNIHPISDNHSSEEYKKHLSIVLLKKAINSAKKQILSKLND